MSSLRVGSLRLCWIEAFVAVVDEENISAAATKLGLSQPMVSRYLQSLEKWLDKKLIKTGGVSDPELPRISIAITEDGRALYRRAGPVLKGLEAFRTPKARAEERISAINAMIGKMAGDLKGKSPSRSATRRGATIDALVEIVGALSAHVPLEALTTVNHSVRSEFAAYERELVRERKLKPKRRPRAIDIASLEL
ncbi:LysR family transcriptional regulator [Tsuneonella troitsensis]|uniref:LysR family transcriptional regulator n=1 Tax=Tsuneonella troitsensis TaxID=292222 RepID=UPI00070B96FF|nr:LysR family transcriptional regulator [Tsuneonella troitsensis]